MKRTTTCAIAAALASLAALPAGADNYRGHGKNGGSIVDVDINAGKGKKSILDVDATVGKGRNLLDLDATVGKSKKGSLLDLDVDVSKKKGAQLDLSIGGRKGNRGGNYDFGGGVGN